ncbi:hypothetical protein F9L33_01920 [Amylibacter sp. SFDW26]|uniref:hypothetical protein n=1 Tax=Amylibacter sp. SFDW26 TaxID=2652722 RepID=UPI001261901A|nr:hypothetical protein [Amylibacter sp. SFDW26]KAB7615545.1 hypothetical protein F9L33_01920 [Amylibacter sp. SFDW26]
MYRIMLSFITVAFTTVVSYAQEAEKPMTLERMGEIVFSLDEAAQSNQNMFQMTVQDIPVLIVTDVQADRMRAMVPIRSAEGMTQEEITRVMQANFDTALDARYAIAQGRLWGVYIHPLSPLKKDQFISGIGQAVNIAKTYGTLYTGGSLNFGAGDSVPLQRQLIDDLLKKGDAI